MTMSWSYLQATGEIGVSGTGGGYHPIMLDGTTIDFAARVADRYFGYESDHGGEEITAIQQVFERVCSSRCATRPFKL